MKIEMPAPRPKRLVSIFLPFKIKEEKIFVFLQKRAMTAKRLAGYFGFWGGGVEEGETPEQGLIREVKEELGIDITMDDVQFFNHYEFLGGIKNVFVISPEDGWENNHLIGEGDYGEWFEVDEVLKRTDVIYEDKVICIDLERRFLNKMVR